MTKSKILLLISPLILFACSNNDSSNDKFSISSANDSLLHINALKTVSNFSRTYKPDSSAYEGSGSLKNIPDSIIQAFKVLTQIDSLSNKKYLIVVFLKLYLDHLRCCHQSYELREPFTLYIDSTADPLLYEFNLATKMFDLSKPYEFISSSIAKTYVEKHEELLRYPEIKQVIDEMKPVEDSIRKHLYWDN